MVVAILSRLFVFVVAVASNHVFGINPTCPSFGCWSIDLPFFNLFSRWDSGFYADIARSGYGTQISPRWEFFPFYPILMGTFGRLLALISPIPLDLAVHIAGFAISNLAFLGAVIFLYKLSERILGEKRLASEVGDLTRHLPRGRFLLGHVFRIAVSIPDAKFSLLLVREANRQSGSIGVSCSVNETSWNFSGCPLPV